MQEETMDLYDISVPLSAALPVYPGDPAVALEQLAPSDDGAVSVTRLTLGTHSGTHLDAPRHVRHDGATMDEIPLDRLMGPATVLEIREDGEIDRRLLHRLPVQGAERLLFKTGNSRLWRQPGFCRDYSALTEDGAAWLVEAGVRLVGIDYLSIEAFSGSGRVHRILLDAGVLILEGLDLSAVPPGPYELICLPLAVAGGDGAPARAVLRGHGRHHGGGPDRHSSRWPL
jgi:arylformamidase